jgi:hypothetical protein
MTAPPLPPTAQPAAARVTWARAAAAAILAFVGLCEMLATNRLVGLDWAPGWLTGTIVIVGYLAFLVLVGLTSFVGNLVVGALVFAMVRRHWRWPLWAAALVAGPYWIAFYQIIPKPW